MNIKTINIKDLEQGRICVGIACHLCEPPNRKECESCKRRVKPKYPAREVWINDTKYVIAEREERQ